MATSMPLTTTDRRGIRMGDMPLSVVPLTRPEEEQSSAQPAIVVPPLLMIWTSPAFPVGAFAFSHGLEKLVEDGVVRDRASLEALLADLIRVGTLKNDFLLMAAVWRAADSGDRDRFREVSELALALQPSGERYLESVTQGRSFFEAVMAAWAAPLLALHHRETPIAYPVALALSARAHEMPLESALFAHGLGFLSNLVSAAIRLSVIGQTDGQRVIAALLPVITAAVHASLPLSLDDLGSALLAADLASLKHETQYSRLFRS